MAAAKRDEGRPAEGKWKGKLEERTAKAMVAKPTRPIAELPMSFVWHTGPWHDMFTLQIEKIRRDVRRANSEDRLIAYLSCPISSRGGGYSSTNVDIAKHVERTLLERWGEGFWILNPVQYQLESKAGSGLMNEHAGYLGLDLDELIAIAGRPTGGDYLRMWTTILAGNDKRVGFRDVGEKMVNTGQFFDAFYFIGPRDAQSFFLGEGTTITAGIQAYLARKFATDPDFRQEYTRPNPSWTPLGPRSAMNEDDYRLRDQWSQSRVDFMRFYGLRASAAFSLGCHDEWIILRELNALRRLRTQDAGRFMVDGDPGQQIAGFFDGGQIDMASSEAGVTRGYSQ